MTMTDVKNSTVAAHAFDFARPINRPINHRARPLGRDRSITRGATPRGFTSRGFASRGFASRGFTLIELMIVVAVIAILTAIAYPAYSSYVIKAHRRAAQGCLMEYANYMERFYTTNLRYDQDATGTAIALPVLDCASAEQTGGSYVYTLTPAATQTSYTVRAAPVGSQMALDTACANISINQTGTRTASGTAGVAGCW